MRSPRLLGLRPLPKSRKPKRAGTKVSAFDLIDARKEDKHRRASLLNALPLLKRGANRRATDLAAQLAYDNRPPETLASAAYFFEARECILDHLVERAQAVPTGELVTVTLLPQRSEHEHLETFDLRRFRERLRQDVQRAGGGSAKGWLFAGVHAEFAEDADCWRPHYHVIVAGQAMIAVVEALRNSGKYKLHPANPNDLPKKPRTPPVRIRTVIRDELRYALSYALQTWFPARWTGQGTTKLNVRSSRKRLDPARHLEFLLWQHKQTISDFYLLVGLEVRGDILALSSRRKRCK